MLSNGDGMVFVKCDDGCLRVGYDGKEIRKNFGFYLCVKGEEKCPHVDNCPAI